jgi:monoamine oxidase
MLRYKSWCDIAFHAGNEVVFADNYHLFSELYNTGTARYFQLRAMKTNAPIVIIGGGLSGLTLAYLLHKSAMQVSILEAAPRLGGRILTAKGLLGTPLELGATWFSDWHPHLQGLIDKLGLQKFPQYDKGKSLFQTKSFEPAQQFEVPESTAPSYRVAGGTGMLIEALKNRIPSTQIYCNNKVVSIEETPQGLLAGTANGQTFSADIVVSCMPPQLLANQVTFIPQLPAAVMELLPAVHTWMAGAVKFTLEYGSPFWRQNGFSGMLYSHAGIIAEMYDHTNAEGNRYGFTGFLHGGAASYTQEVRKDLVLNQLEELMGPEARQISMYADKVWNDEYVIAGNPVIHRPHQNNGHPLLQVPYHNGKFYFCGTETAMDAAGYMEGAVIAATAVAGKIAGG